MALSTVLDSQLIVREKLGGTYREIYLEFECLGFSGFFLNLGILISKAPVLSCFETRGKALSDIRPRMSRVRIMKRDWPP